MFNIIFKINILWLEKGDIFVFEVLFLLLIYGIWLGFVFNVLIFIIVMFLVDKNFYKLVLIDGIGGIK